MKEKIISIVVVIGMIIVANYPLYSSLKSTANEVNDMVTHMREEIAVWKDDVQKLQGKFEEIRTELLDTVDKISELKNKSEKVNNTIDSLKTVEPVDAIKNLFKIGD
jgi:peptidoglycan hydrolase CwlO-like protein